MRYSFRLGLVTILAFAVLTIIYTFVFPVPTTAQSDRARLDPPSEVDSLEEVLADVEYLRRNLGLAIKQQGLGLVENRAIHLRVALILACDHRVLQDTDADFPRTKVACDNAKQDLAAITQEIAEEKRDAGHQ